MAKPVAFRIVGWFKEAHFYSFTVESELYFVKNKM